MGFEAYYYALLGFYKSNGFIGGGVNQEIPLNTPMSLLI